MQWQAETVIGRLRVRGARSGCRPIEQRARRVLDGADWRGAGLPSSAILCIRRLADPEPGRLRLDGDALRPPAAWESAARSAISHLASRAARPSRGFVPSTAEAVLFLDRAELLASLARDWCDGGIGARWWWRALFRRGDEAAAVVAAWRETPQHVPAACHLAATWGVIVPFVSRLTRLDSTDLMLRTATVFGVVLPVSASGITTSADSDRDELQPCSTGPTQDEHPALTHHVEAIARRSVASALRRYAPELSGASLGPEQRILACAGLVLHRAPAHERIDLLTAGIIEDLSRVTLAGVSDASARPLRDGGVDSNAVEMDARAIVTQSAAPPPPQAHEDVDADLLAAALEPTAVDDRASLETPHPDLATPIERPHPAVIDSALGG